MLLDFGFSSRELEAARSVRMILSSPFFFTSRKREVEFRGIQTAGKVLLFFCDGNYFIISNDKNLGRSTSA